MHQEEDIKIINAQIDFLQAIVDETESKDVAVRFSTVISFLRELAHLKELGYSNLQKPRSRRSKEKGDIFDD